MVNAGRILIVPKGVWSSLTSYDMLDLVTQDGVAYIARQANVGVQPKTDSQYTYWQPFGNASEPDNETIIYTENNKYTVNLDDKTLVYDGDEGCITVAIDGTTIKFDEDEGYLYADVKSNLADLLDVVLTTPTNGQVLTYNAVTGKWVNANPTGGMQAHLVITSEAGNTVTVTTPSGSVITATQVSGSTTQWECDTQEYGVHTIDAVLAGDDAQITVTVDTCKVYNIDDSHIHASITVTFPRGFTCRCQGQGENYYANSNPYTFSVHHLGEYTITATDGGSTTYTETVTISSSAQSVNMFCPSVTNAPTDDIRLWLMFGSILDKTYTTLSEVLADSTTLSTLIADNNAVDYMVRSKSWCGIKVPKMTDNTHPSGECFGSTAQGSNTFYKAFDGDDSSSFWQATSSDSFDTCHIGYEFENPICVKRVTMTTTAYDERTTRITSFQLQGSNDGNTWIDIGGVITRPDSASTLTTNTDYATNTASYKKHRVRILSGVTMAAISIHTLQFSSDDLCADSTAMSLIGLNNYVSNTLLSDADWLNAICNSAYFESVLNVKVPTMTDNTHPSGECSASSYATSINAYPWKAFTGSASDVWMASSSSLPQWIAYKFANPVKIYCVEFDNEPSGGHNMVKDYTVHADDTQILSSTCEDKNSAYMVKEAVTTPTVGETFKINLPNTYASQSMNMRKIQFYGRQDV